MISITATIISGSNFGPVEIPIPGGGCHAYILHWSNVSWPVGIGSLAFISIMLGRGLPPKSVLFFGLRTGLSVSVWIVQWKKVPFQDDLWLFIIIILPIKTICEFGVVCVVFDQFVEHPGSHSRADPLTSMNSTEERFCKKIFTFKFILFQNLSIHMAGLLPQPPLQTYENSICVLLNLRPFKTFITIMSWPSWLCPMTSFSQKSQVRSR